MFFLCSIPIPVYNRNKNRRVQKERLSFERNYFHGSPIVSDISMVTKMAQCLISKLKKEKYENIIRKRNSKKIRATFSTDSLSSPTPLSSSFFLVSLRTCKLIHGYHQEMESCCCVDSRPFWRENRWERCGTRRGIVCCAIRRSWGGTSTKASAQKIVFQAAHEDKERKRRWSSIKKKIPTHLFLVVSPSNFRWVVGFLPTVNQQ